MASQDGTTPEHDHTPGNSSKEVASFVNDAVHRGITVGAPLVSTISDAYQNIDVTLDGVNIRNLVPRDGEEVASLVDRFLDRLSHASKAQQITAGGATGWVSGYLFNKFGKPVLYAIGSTLIIVLFAEHQGYLTVDWNKFRTDYDSSRRTVERRVRELTEPIGMLERRNGKPWLDKLKILARSSPYLSGGFLGGILLGLAS